MNIDSKQVESSLHRFLEGDTTIDCDNLHTRSDQRGGLFRLPIEDGGTVVVKVWFIRNCKEWFKSIARLSNGWREWCMHRLLYKSGIVTPEPIAFFRLSTRKRGEAEAMIMEDIGPVTSSLSVLKKFISKGDEAEVISFENRLIDLTVDFVDLKIVDIDHQLNNLVVDDKERLLRVDLECAQKIPFFITPRKKYVKMLARFITGHIHAVQPDVSRSVHFTERLYEKLRVDHQAKVMINAQVRENLAYQLAYKGIETEVKLPL
jgi:hypothetical protein